ncbi:MAG: SCO family protein [Pseudomonadota bacterium]
MPSKLNMPTVIGIAALAMLAGAITQRLIGAGDATAPPDTAAATVIPQPVALPAFELDGVDRSFDNAALQDRWSLVFFGFTNCPDICPTTLATLAGAAEKIRRSVPAFDVVFVSVDPRRDQPTDAQRYASYFDKAFIGVTGSDQALAALAKPLGILYFQVPQGDDAYTVDHSSSLLLVNPRGELAAVFSAPHDADAIANDIIKIAAIDD